LTVRLRVPAKFKLLPAAVVAMTVAGCVQKPIVQRTVAPNPFGYVKQSAVCKTAPVQTAADGTLSVAMSVRSDDGQCALAVQAPGGGNYVSFGVDPAPDHGKAFLYNYDDHTYVTYTPATAYAGSDSFTAILIPSDGKPRVRLKVAATVDATGVVVHTAPTPAVSAPAATTGKKTATRRHATVRRHK